MQKYQPNYEPLSDTLKRLMSHGLTETEAKLDICLALRDRERKIEVLATIRLVNSAGRTIATSAGRPIIDPRIRKRTARFVGPIDVQIVIPRDLAPDHLDWENSRLLKPCAMQGRAFRDYHPARTLDRARQMGMAPDDAGRPGEHSAGARNERRSYARNQLFQKTADGRSRSAASRFEAASPEAQPHTRLTPVSRRMDVCSQGT